MCADPGARAPIGASRNCIGFSLYIDTLYPFLFCFFFIYKYTNAGAAVTAKMSCNVGHEEVWCSSRNVGSGREAMPHINVLLIVYAFMTGLHFDQLKV